MNKTNNLLNNQKYILGNKEKRKVLFEYILSNNNTLKSALWIYLSIFIIIFIGMIFIFKNVESSRGLINFTMLGGSILIVTLFPVFSIIGRMREKGNYIIYKKTFSYSKFLKNYEIIKNNNTINEEINYVKNDFNNLDEYISKI